MSHSSPRQLLIGGRWVTTSARLPVINPYSGEEIARVPLGNTDTIDAAISAAVQAFPIARSMPAHARTVILQKVVQGIQSRRAQFTELIVAEAGKPIAYAEVEVARAIATFTLAAEEARRWNAESGDLVALDAFPSGENHLGFYRRFPIGVISALTPFNFPLNLVAHKIGPCLATGNTMVLKPAPKTPLTALLLGEVLTEAGMSPGQVNIITCSNEDAPALVRDDRVKMVSFTGSPAVGWNLKEQCGRKKIALELGGNAGVIVEPDTDLDSAIPMIAAGSFAYSGQTCISVQRIFIADPIYQEFKDRFVTFIHENIHVGDPRERQTVIGPMISSDALERTRRRVQSALDAGAKLVCGNEVSGSALSATVLEDVPANHDAVTCEFFAPVVTLHRYSDFSEALDAINDSAFGLQAGVFTRDLRKAMKAFEALDVGGVMINQIPTFRGDNMPYGGVKESGFGREGVQFAMAEMTEPRMLVIRTA